jgi:hypothetical protein
MGGGSVYGKCVCDAYLLVSTYLAQKERFIFGGKWMKRRSLTTYSTGALDKVPFMLVLFLAA